jgi:hypothetical protein
MFANPLGLFALLAVPAVVALHLYRRRFEPRPVSALFLWAVDDRMPVAGRKREPLRTSVSFWSECLAALLLALAFGGPRSGCAAGRSEHLVVVLDSSASMGAVSEGKSTRARAVELVEERIAALGRGSRVTLVQSGPRPSLVAGPAAFPAEARAELETWQPGAAHHDLAPAVALALQFAGDARVTLVTDHYEPEAWPETIEVVSLGRPLDNWAITRASRARERGEDGVEHEKLFLTLASFASTARTVAVRISASGRELARQEEVLEPGKRAHFALPVSDGVGMVEARIDADGLALDDSVLLAPPPARTLALFAALEEAELHALGLADGGEHGIARWLALVPRSVAAPSADAAHLVIARAALAAPAAWTLVLEPLGGERKDLIGPFLADRASTLLEGTTLEGSVWSVDPALVLPGAPLVSAGSQPILAEERRGERVTWHWNFDPARSSLQRSPDWPILLANMAELRRSALPGPERTNLGVGERFTYRPGAELAGVDRTAPVVYALEGPLGDASKPLREIPALEEVVVDGLERPGAYRLTFGARTVAEFAVAFTDAAESDLRGANAGRHPATRAGAELEAEFSWIQLALIVGALGLALLDWFALSRLSSWTGTA